MNIVGVTIGCGERFGRMARLAKREFERCTGRPAYVFDHVDQARFGLAQPHRLKFQLFRLLDHTVDAVVFFDADMIFLEEFDPGTLLGPDGFAAVRDIEYTPWVREDAERARVRPEDYFNSGFFVIERRCEEVLDLAAVLTGYLRTPFKDQTHLNAAANLLRVRTRLLAPRFNHHVDRRHTRTLAAVTGAHVHWLCDVPDGELERYYGPELRELFWRA